jgi:hypothetical protein
MSIDMYVFVCIVFMCTFVYLYMQNYSYVFVYIYKFDRPVIVLDKSVQNSRQECAEFTRYDTHLDP